MKILFYQMKQNYSGLYNKESYAYWSIHQENLQESLNNIFKGGKK